MSEMGTEDQVFDHLPTQDELVAAYCPVMAGQNARNLERPDLPWKDLANHSIIVVSLCVVAATLARRKPHGKRQSTVILSLLVYVAVNAKSLLIFSIRVYQRYAPARIRENCCFEPSCSEYMRLAIDKYGVCRGALKGFSRLRRCGPSGGVDYP